MPTWTTSVAMFGASYRRATLLEQDAGEHLAAATAFLGSGDYTAADRELANARGRLESAGYREGPLQENVTDLTAAIAAKTQSIGDFGQFQELRHRIHSEMYALDRDILDQAQTHCRTALDLFGVFAVEPWKSQADFEHLDPARQAMLDEGAVELLFVWARLEMRKSETQPATERNAGYRRAIEALGKVEKSHPSITAVALWTADCWETLGEQKAAAEARAQAASRQPTSATDYYLLGEYHAQHGRPDQALASYWQALTRQPDHYLSLLAAGVTLGELQKYESAETMLTGAIAMNPHPSLPRKSRRRRNHRCPRPHRRRRKKRRNHAYDSRNKASRVRPFTAVRRRRRFRPAVHRGSGPPRALHSRRRLSGGRNTKKNWGVRLDYPT